MGEGAEVKKVEVCEKIKSALLKAKDVVKDKDINFNRCSVRGRIEKEDFDYMIILTDFECSEWGVSAVFEVLTASYRFAGDLNDETEIEFDVPIGERIGTMVLRYHSKIDEVDILTDGMRVGMYGFDFVAIIDMAVNILNRLDEVAEKGCLYGEEGSK